MLLVDIVIDSSDRFVSYQALIEAEIELYTHGGGILQNKIKLLKLESQSQWAENVFK